MKRHGKTFCSEKSDMDMSYKVAIYVRESKDENEENRETIETQRDLLIDFVKKNSLGEICRIYVDDNVSGSGFEREGIRRLEDDIEAGIINMLVIKDLSRLGRNNAKTLLFLDFLEERGVRVVTSDGRYDSLDDNDLVGIETWFNERYIRDISRKIRANLRFKIEKGEYIGKAPYGYVKSGEQKNKLVIDESTAGVVRRIFNLYRQGYGYSSIAKALNEAGIVSPSGKTSGKGWGPVAIKRILSNRVYTGDTVQGVSEKVSFKSKKTRRLPEERWVVTPNTHEAIISKEEFEEVSRIREGKLKFSGSHKGEIHLLRGVLFCGKCGYPMFARKRKQRPMGYICGRYAVRGLAACSSHYVREDEIKGILINELLGLLRNESVQKKLKERIDECFLQHVQHNQNQRQKLEKQLALKQKQQETLYMDRLEGKISEQLFMRINQNLENKISMLKLEISRACDNKGAPAFGEPLDKVRGYLEQGYISNEIIKEIVDSIAVYDAGEGMGGEDGAIVIDFKINKV